MKLTGKLSLGTEPASSHAVLRVHDGLEVLLQSSADSRFAGGQHHRYPAAIAAVTGFGRKRQRPRHVLAHAAVQDLFTNLGALEDEPFIWWQQDHVNDILRSSKPRQGPKVVREQIQAVNYHLPHVPREVAKATLGLLWAP